MPLVMSLNGKAILYLLLTYEFKDLRIMICLAIVLLTIFVICKIIKTKNQEEQEEQGWQFLFEIYNQRIFLLIYIVRVAFVSLIIGWLQKSPKIQASLILLVNFGMLVYLISSSPIKKKMSNIQHKVIEAALFLYNGMFAILAVLDLKDDDGVKNASGQLMIILYLVTSIITAIIILINPLNTHNWILIYFSVEFQRLPTLISKLSSLCSSPKIEIVRILILIHSVPKELS